VSTDCLRYDDFGKPVGLNWEAISPAKPEPEVLTKNPPKKVKKRKAGKCGKGHDLNEHGRMRKDQTGMYCLVCKNANAAKQRAEGKQKAYRKRKREEAKAS